MFLIRQMLFLIHYCLFASHLLFLLLDHLLNHITADRTVLSGSQVSVYQLYLLPDS